MDNIETNDIAIEFSGVGKKYSRTAKLTRLKDVFTKVANSVKEDNEFWALTDVSFEVKKGEAVGIIGSNGSGKSTLLKLLSGVTVPSAGEIKVNGTIGGLIELGAGFHPEMTGRENIYINGAILGLSKKEIDDRFPQIIEFSGLADFVDMPLKSYSSGMKVRLGFAIAITIETDIVLLDEVLAVGDSKFRKKALQMMESFLADKTIVFVSHDLGQIKRICNKCIVLDRGKLIFAGDTEEALKVYQEKADANQSRYTKKISNHKTHLVEGILFDENQKESTVFEYGADFSIYFKVHVHPNHVGSQLKIKLKADEISTFSDTISEFKVEMSSSGIIEKNLKINHLPLYNGKYNVDVILTNSQNEILEIKTDVLSFAVEKYHPDFKMRGFITIPSHLGEIDLTSENVNEAALMESNDNNIEILLSNNQEEIKYYIVTFHKLVNKTLKVPITHFTVPVNTGQQRVLTLETKYLDNGEYTFDLIKLNGDKKTIQKKENVLHTFVNDKKEKAGLVYLMHSWT
ncbi:ABC transporter ATP-binding protein [Metabacillus indicus]|uniref:ABC transporter ATP-binding protein n=1 Tax=Metabacillus indicus TaxID=246786 RepID=UPI0009D63EB0|nr:polysaccharide ABC transporter ATP-binding protein [Metabacillus indicus]